MSTGFYIKANYPDVKNIYLIGTEQFRSQLSRQGFNVTHATDMPVVDVMNPESIDRILIPYDIQAVVIGHDTRFTYNAGAIGSVLVQNGARMIGANDDPFFVIGRGKNRPGCGTLTRYMETATQQKVEVVGKPKTFILDKIIEDHNLSKNGMIMVGDSMSADIRLGYNAKIDTLLVLTGVSQREDLINHDILPTYILPNLGSIFNIE